MAVVSYGMLQPMIARRLPGRPAAESVRVSPSPPLAMPGSAFDLAAVVTHERVALPHDALAVPSMLSYEERALLHWAAREGFGANGALVDAGCFLGGSTLALGFGLAQARSRPAPIRTDVRVHSYDLFKVGMEWERIYFPPEFPFAVGASTLELYEGHIAPVRELVEIHSGDIANSTWPGEPIATLFVDIAKTYATSDAVLERFFPFVVADTVLVEQDLVHHGHPWRAIAMELLGEYLEYCGHVAYSSAVYRVKAPIPPGVLPTRILERLSADEALALVDRCARRVGEPMAGQLLLAGAHCLADFGEYARARARVREVRARYDDDTVPWISQGIQLIPQWIDALEGGAAVVT